MPGFYTKNLIPSILLSMLTAYVSVCPAQSNTWIQSLQGDTQKTLADTTLILDQIELGNHLREQAEYSKATKKLQDALSEAGTLQYAKGKAHAHYALGVVSFEQRDYPGAEDHLTTSLKLSEAYDYTYQVACNQNYLGALYGVQGDMERAMLHFSSALQYFEKTTDQKAQSVSHYLMGNLHRSQGAFDVALVQYETGLAAAQAAKFAWSIAANQSGAGTVYGNRGLYTEALSRFSAALHEWEKLGNQKGISDTYHHIGAVYFYKSNLADALTYYLKALHLREVLGDPLKIAESYHDIGHIYIQQGNNQQALLNYQSALNVFKQTGNQQRIGLAYNSIGNAYTNLGDTPKALEHFEASIAIQEAIGDKAGLIYSYANTGRMYIVEKEYDKALHKLLAAQKHGIALNDHEGLSLIYHHLGRLHILTQNYSEAKEYLEKSLVLATGTGNKNMLMYGYEQMAILDSAEGNSPMALFHYKRYKSYADSILTEEKGKIIADLQVKYETEKKDHEILRLQDQREIDRLHFGFQKELLGRTQAEKEKINADNRYHVQTIQLMDHEKKLQQLRIEKNNADILAQRAEAGRKQDQLTLLSKEGELQAIRLKKQTLLKNILLASLLVTGLLSFVVYHYFITRQKLKLQTLRNKIASDLHDDVGSTLSSIAIFSEIAQQQSKEVAPLLNTITENSRQMLDAMADIVWTINPENDHFEKIILRMRSYAYELLGAKKIQFDFKADDDVSSIKLPMDVRKNLFLIFKEATNNIVKYAEADTALFSLQSDGDYLSMIIRDNGKGFDTNMLTEGNGLKNMMKRAKEVGGILLIESLPGNGTSIQLKIAV